MSTIILDDVAKAYGSMWAVAGVSLRVQEGELLALLGPSGCGKTTTLRMIAGFVGVTRGRILFGERDVTALPPNRRNTGMVFQGFALFPHMTVAENVAYGLEMRGVGKAERAERVAKMLDRVQLGRFADRLPRQLSGGQQQRVALARALVINPDVLLLDEPLSALDAKLRHDVRQEIRSLQQSLNLTTVFVTHDQEEALSLADRLVVMRSGEIEQIGSPVELYQKPRTLFVADFIGKSNFVKGSVTGSTFTSAFGAVLSVANPDGRSGEVTLAFRPEKVSLRPAASAGGSQGLAGTVDLVSFVGPITDYRVRLNDGQTVQVHVHNQDGAPAPLLERGAVVGVELHPESCMVF